MRYQIPRSDRLVFRIQISIETKLALLVVHNQLPVCQIERLKPRVHTVVYLALTLTVNVV